MVEENESKIEYGGGWKKRGIVSSRFFRATRRRHVPLLRTGHVTGSENAAVVPASRGTLAGFDREGRGKRTREMSDGVRGKKGESGRSGSLKVLENEGDGGIEAWLWKGKYFIIEKLRLNGNVSLFTP